MAKCRVQNKLLAMLVAALVVGPVGAGSVVVSAARLTPFPAVSVERRDLALTVGVFGRYANATNVLSQYSRFLRSKEEAAR
jgi:hypothetical protein